MRFVPRTRKGTSWGGIVRGTILSLTVCVLFLTLRGIFVPVDVVCPLPLHSNVSSIPAGFPRSQTPPPTAVVRVAQRCLLNSPHLPTPAPKLLENEYRPPSDLEQHYKEMLELTIPLRHGPVKDYVGYCGPWIEDLWIERFCCDRPLSDFGGLVPLFLQWNDNANLAHYNNFDTPEFQRFFSHLRQDVLYVTVSQSDNGINHIVPDTFPFPNQTWNILVFSAGGFGHIPIPLLMGELPVEHLASSFKYTISFTGTAHAFSKVRTETIAVATQVSKNNGISFTHYSGPRWKDINRKTALNLAPRGFGRTSFHLYELIQMGFIPVHIYDDHEWLPYRGTPAFLKEFGWSVKITEYREWLEQISRIVMSGGNLDLDEKRRRLLRYRKSHYTYEGVLNHIEHFLRSDGLSDLSCQRHPRVSVSGVDEDQLR